MLDRTPTLDVCKICLQGKIAEQPFPTRVEISQERLEIVHSDVCGPFRTQSKDGAAYFVSFTDDFSQWVYVYFLKKKSDVLEAFKLYKNELENLTNSKIKNLQSDNGREFVNNNFYSFLKLNGIHRRLSIPHTPEQNGVAERRNRTLVEMARCMFIQGGLPPSFLAEAVSSANYLRNRCPTKTLHSKLLYEKWTRKKLNLGHLKTFGSKVVILEKGSSRDKFDAKGLKGVFVGY